MIGAVCYGVGTFLTLRSGMATFESTCYTVDNIIDRYVDINTISPVFWNKGFMKATLRSKSERTLFYKFYDIVFQLCDQYCADCKVDMPKFTLEGLWRAIDRQDVEYTKIVDAMFTHVCKIGHGDITWLATKEDTAVHGWVQDHISLEDRQIIQSAMILMDDLAKDKRLG